MRTATIKLYEFSELSDAAKERAVEKHKDFLDSLPLELENEAGELKEYYYEYPEEEVIENIEANEYIFFADGKLANCVTYIGKHPKAGITEFTFKGETIEI